MLRQRKRRQTRMIDEFSCLRKFASLGCYTQQRLGKKKICSWGMLTTLMKNKFEKKKKNFKFIIKVLFRFFHYKCQVHAVLSVHVIFSIHVVLSVHVYFLCSRHFLYPRRFICPRIFSLFTYNYKLICIYDLFR